MIAALVDGAPLTQGATRPSRWVSETWALPLDVEAGTLGEPERLGASDGGNKTVAVCGPQDGGWVLDGKWPASAINATAVSGTSLHPTGLVFARYHVTPTSLCLEKLSSGSYGEATGTGSLGKTDGPFVTAGIYIDHARQSFRCIQ
jgi:hypothetical protein